MPDGVRGLSTLMNAVNTYSSVGGVGVLCATHGDEMAEAIRGKMKLAERMLFGYGFLEAELGDGSLR